MQAAAAQVTNSVTIAREIDPRERDFSIFLFLEATGYPVRFPDVNIIAVSPLNSPDVDPLNHPRPHVTCELAMAAPEDMPAGLEPESQASEDLYQIDNGGDYDGP